MEGIAVWKCVTPGADYYDDGWSHRQPDVEIGFGIFAHPSSPSQESGIARSGFFMVLEVPLQDVSCS